MKEQHDKPQLFVISGANGAGKSSFTQILVPENTIIINPDIIAEKFNNTQRADLHIGLTKSKARENQQNISIETNFLFEDEINDFLEFKEKGYEINLIFIALRDLEESKLRVDTRVSKGGHYVNDYTRELNFKIGKENTINLSNRFDRVTVISNSYDFQDNLLYAEKGKILYYNKEAPIWAKNLINDFDKGLNNDINFSTGYKR